MKMRDSKFLRKTFGVQYKNWRHLFVGALMACPYPPILPPLAPQVIPPLAPTGAVVKLLSRTEKPITSISIGGIKTFFRGTGTKHLFTIPPGLEECPYNVEISYGDGSSEEARLTVEHTLAPSVPKITLPVEVVRINSDAAAYLFVYGSGFDTSSEIWLDGNSVKTFSPGFEEERPQQLVMSDLYMNCNNNSWVDCSPLAGSVLGAKIQLAELRRPGPHTVEVRSKLTGFTTKEQRLADSIRALLLKVIPSCSLSDRRFDSLPLPEVVVRQHEISTVRRVLGQLGYLIDLQVKGRPDDIDCNLNCGLHCQTPDTLLEKGPGYTMPDIINALTGLSSVNANGDWTLSAIMLSYFMDDAGPRLDVYGLRPSNVNGFAVFTTPFNQPGPTLATRSYFLRTFLHELGHGLGLTHCQGDRTHTTLMNQDSCLDQENWNFTFSDKAQSILVNAAISQQLPRVNQSLGEISQSECLCSTAPEQRDASKVRFELELPEQERSVELGTPISLVATLFNNGPLPVIAVHSFDPTYGFVTYSIWKEGEVKERIFMPYFQLETGASGISVEGGRNLSAKVPLFCGSDGYAFAEPGRYLIQGHFHGLLGELRGLEISSNKVQLQVESDPARLNLELVMASPGGCLLALAGGGDTPPLREAASNLASLLQQPITSQLASYARLALGEYLARSVPELPNIHARAADYKQARDLFSQVRENDLGGYFPLRLLTGRVETAIESRDFAGADEILKQLQRKTVGDSDALPYLDKAQRILDNRVQRNQLKVNELKLRQRLESLGCNISSLNIEPKEVEMLALKGDPGAPSQVEIDPGSLDSIKDRVSRDGVVKLPLLPVTGIMPKPEEVVVRLPLLSKLVTAAFHVNLEEFDGFEVTPKVFEKTIPIMSTCLQNLPSAMGPLFVPVQKNIFIKPGKRKAKIGVELNIPMEWSSTVSKISEEVTISRP